MKALEDLKMLKEYIENENRLGDLDYAHYSIMIDYVHEAIEDLEALQERILHLETIETDVIMEENKNCENCKDGVENQDKTITCTAKASPEDKYSGEVLKGKYYYRHEKDFCCNRWEQKQ